MAKQTNIWWDQKTQTYFMTVPYDENFLDLLKALIPYSDRAYNRDKKMWIISERFGLPVKSLCEKVWGSGSVFFVPKGDPSTVVASGAGISNVALEFLRLLPFDVVQRAYRQAAMKLHPDHNGDEKKMAALNASWKRIKKELFNNG